MDREALIARREAAGLWAKRWLQGVPTALELDAFYDGWDARGAPTATDAKLLEELKGLCDRGDKRYWETPVMGAEPTVETSEIRAIFGWNATTKDLHTKTTKGDT